MTSRAAILSTLVLGFLLSSTGAGLAISGFAANNQAAVAQYPKDTAGGGKNAVLPAHAEEAGPAGQQAVQPARQIRSGLQESSGDQLPFTGFAAIPILVIGLGLVSAGVVLARTARRN